MNGMTRHIRQMVLLAAGLLAGCAVETPEVKTHQTEIAVKTNLTPMRKRANTINNVTALQGYDLKIDAYFHGTDTKYLDGVKLHYNESEWMFWDGSAQLHYYWPIEGSVYDPDGVNITNMSLDFVGFCPYEKPSYIGTPTYNHATGASFTATLPTTTVAAVDYMTIGNQASLQEHLIAVLDSQTLAKQTAAGGALPLQFKHPFALVKFVLNAASGTHVQIDSISIAELNTGGTCTYNGTTMSWGSYTGSGTLIIREVLKIGGTTETSTGFVVIPQNYGTKYLTVSATWDDWSHPDKVTISDYGTEVDLNWEAGRIYTYNLTLDKYGLKVDAGKYTEQW